MTTYRIEVRTEVQIPTSLRRQVIRAANLTLEDAGRPTDSELTLVITGETEMRRLNREYRGLDSVTDVLSFEMKEPLPDGGYYLGDVIIALPIAVEQAQAGGHSLIAEVSLLTIHGVLHLLGEDHANPDDKAAMWAKQTRLMEQLGLEAVPTESQS
ncbi:MAG TPA: rRNA maturation RNase YbeY [Candidatus Binatia bacterium]|nr:rRNA maturation RNase YbeY [Candidatus Binatia bacterium]